MLENWEIELREEASEIHLYGKYSSPSTHSLDLHISCVSAVKSATQTFLKQGIFKEV